MNIFRRLPTGIHAPEPSSTLNTSIHMSENPFFRRPLVLRSIIFIKNSDFLSLFSKDLFRDILVVAFW